MSGLIRTLVIVLVFVTMEVKSVKGTKSLEEFTPPEMVKVEDGSIPLGITLLSIDRYKLVCEIIQ